MYNLDTNFINQDRFPRKPTLPERLQRKAEKGLKVADHLTKRAGEKLANGKESLKRARQVFREEREGFNLQNFSQKIPEAVGKMYEVAIDPTKPLPGQKTFKKGPNAGGAIKFLPNAKKVEGSISDTAFSSITTELDRILSNFEQRANINSELSPEMLSQQTMGEICFQLKIDYVPIQMRRAIKLAFEQVNVEFIQRNNINNQDASRMSNREIVSKLLLQTLGEYVKGTKVVANDKVNDHNAALQRNIKFGHLINREGGSINSRDKANDVGATQELTVASIIAGWKGLVSDQAEYREGDLENRQNLNSNRPQFKPQPIPPTPPTPEELAQLALVKAENLKKLGNLESEVLDLSQAEDVSDLETQELNYLDEDNITNKLGRLNDPNIAEDDFKYIINELPTKADLYKVIRDFKNLVQADSVTNPEVISWLMDAANERKNINSRDLLVQEGDLAPLNIESEQEIKTVEVQGPKQSPEMAKEKFNGFLAHYSRLKDADNSDPALNKKAPELQKSADGMYNALCKPVLVQIIEDSLHEWSNNDIFLLLQYYKSNKQNEPGYENFITNFVEILADLAPKREREVASLEQIISGQSGTVITEELPNTNPVEQSRENKDVAKIVSLVQKLPSEDIVVGSDQVLRITSSVENNNTEVKLVITGNESTTITFNHINNAQDMSVAINNQIGSNQVSGTQSFDIKNVQQMFRSLANSINKPVDLQGVINSLKSGLSQPVSEVTTNPEEQSQETQNNQKLNAEINRYLLDLNEEGGAYGVTSLVESLKSKIFNDAPDPLIHKKLKNIISSLYHGDDKIAKAPHLAQLQEVYKTVNAEFNKLEINSPSPRLLEVAALLENSLKDLQRQINPVEIPAEPIPVQPTQGFDSPEISSQVDSKILDNLIAPENSPIIENFVEKSRSLETLVEIIKAGAKDKDAVDQLLKDEKLISFLKDSYMPDLQKADLAGLLTKIEKNLAYSDLIKDNSEQFNQLKQLVGIRLEVAPEVVEVTSSSRDSEVIIEELVSETPENNAKVEAKRVVEKLSGMLDNTTNTPAIKSFFEGAEWLNLIKVDLVNAKIDYVKLDLFLTNLESSPQLKDVINDLEYTDGIEHLRSLIPIASQDQAELEQVVSEGGKAPEVEMSESNKDILSNIRNRMKQLGFNDGDEQLVITNDNLPYQITLKIQKNNNNQTMFAVSYNSKNSDKILFEGDNGLGNYLEDTKSVGMFFSGNKVILTGISESKKISIEDAGKTIQEIFGNIEIFKKSDGSVQGEIIENTVVPGDEIKGRSDVLETNNLGEIIDGEVILKESTIQNQSLNIEDDILDSKTREKIAPGKTIDDWYPSYSLTDEQIRLLTKNDYKSFVTDLDKVLSEINNNPANRKKAIKNLFENYKFGLLASDEGNKKKKNYIKDNDLLDNLAYILELIDTDQNFKFVRDEIEAYQEYNDRYNYLSRLSGYSKSLDEDYIQNLYDELNPSETTSETLKPEKPILKNTIELVAESTSPEVVESSQLETLASVQETNEQRLDRLSAEATDYFDNTLTVDGVEYEGFYRLSEDIKAMTATDESLENALNDDKLVPLLKNFQVLLDLMADSSDTEFQDISKDASLKLDEFIDEAKTNSYKGSILQEAINIMYDGFDALEKKTY